jgi:hypothetical protein
MKQLLFCAFLLAFVFTASHAQQASYAAVSDAAHIPWENYTPAGKRFILAGEAHHVSSIFPFQLSHLTYLVSQGFRHLVWEVPYSYSLQAQSYLDNGDDSALSVISWSVEDRVYWSAIRALNQSLPAGDRLHLWGIDHELDDNAGGMRRASDYKKALRLLVRGRGPVPAPLRDGYASLDTATMPGTLKAIKNGFRQSLSDPSVAAFFGDRFIDFTILVNRIDHYKVRRNDEMLAAFAEICALYHLDSHAKFLGRFGWGHTDRSLRQSLSWMLENDPSSPVRNSVYVVGVQYIHCYSSVSKEEIENTGIVGNGAEKKELAAIDRLDPSPIKIFLPPSGGRARGWAQKADVLFVFSGFAASTRLK